MINASFEVDEEEVEDEVDVDEVDEDKLFVAPSLDDFVTPTEEPLLLPFSISDKSAYSQVFENSEF
jgi:hypothetical protein